VVSPSFSPNLSVSPGHFSPGCASFPMQVCIISFSFLPVLTFFPFADYAISPPRFLRPHRISLTRLLNPIDETLDAPVCLSGCPLAFSPPAPFPPFFSGPLKSQLPVSPRITSSFFRDRTPSPVIPLPPPLSFGLLFTVAPDAYRTFKWLGRNRALAAQNKIAAIFAFFPRFLAHAVA